MQNDEQLREKIQATLDADPDMQAYGVKADVIDGRVQLTGIVDTVAEKNKASKIIARVNGVKEVENGLTVSTDGQINDRWVEFEVTEELARQPGVNLKNIGVKSVGGKVFLMGRTSDSVGEQAAVQAATRARGVTEVISQVKRQQKEMSLNDIFHSQVNNDQGTDKQEV